MSDQPTPETPERDSWRTVALGFNELHTTGRFSSLTAVEDRIVDLTARVDALLAVEDKHPPVFHIRPVSVVKTVQVEPGEATMDVADALGADVTVTEEVMVTEWRWVAERNGRKLYGSTESYEHRPHAIAMAHRFADPLGARVLDDEGNEV